jgi:hypothetical protein
MVLAWPLFDAYTIAVVFAIVVFSLLELGFGSGYYDSTNQIVSSPCQAFTVNVSISDSNFIATINNAGQAQTFDTAVTPSFTYQVSYVQEPSLIINYSVEVVPSK